jgi:hypothetical protein
MASLSYPQVYKSLSWYLNNVDKLQKLLNAILSKNSDMKQIQKEFINDKTDYLSFAFNIYMDGMHSKQTLFFPNIACKLISQTDDILEIKRIIHEVSHCTLDVKNEIPFNSKRQIYYRTIVFQVGYTFIVIHPQSEKESEKVWIYGSLTYDVKKFVDRLVTLGLIILNQNDSMAIYNIIENDGIHPFYQFTLLNSLCDTSVISKEPAALNDLIIYNIQNPITNRFLQKFYDFVQSFLVTKRSTDLTKYSEHFQYCITRLHKVFRITKSYKKTSQNKLIDYLVSSFYLQRKSQTTRSEKVAISTEQEMAINHKNNQTIVIFDSEKISLIADIVSVYCKSMMVADEVKVDNLNLYVNEIGNQVVLFNIFNNPSTNFNLRKQITYTLSLDMGQVKERKFLSQNQEYRTVYSVKASQLTNQPFVSQIQDYNLNPIDKIDIAILSQVPKGLTKILGVSDISFLLNQDKDVYMMFSENMITTKIQRFNHFSKTSFIESIIKQHPRILVRPFGT